MATSGLCSSISRPFPQPCRPFHAHDASTESMEDENKQNCDTFIHHDLEYPTLYESGEEYNISADDGDEGESLKISRRFCEKLDEQGHIMYKKLHFKFRRNGTVDKKFRKTLHDSERSVVSDLLEKSSDSEASNDHNKNTERGIDIGDILSSNQGEMEELKLERFKVKAVNFVGVGVVKEEKY